MRALSVLLLAASRFGLVLGQGGGAADPSVQCFQPRLADSPNATVLTSFINPAINTACGFFNQPNAGIGPLIYNLTGYSFAKLNIDLLAPNLTECRQAFSSIVTQCIQTSSSFGGQWSPQLALSYFLTNVVYPANPIQNTKPPPSSSTTSPSTTTSSSISVTTTPPPSNPGNAGKDVTDAVALAAAAAAAFLAVSWLGPLAELEATAALTAVSSASKSKPHFETYVARR